MHGTDLNRIEVGLLGALERASLLQLKMKGTPMAHEVIRIMIADEAILGELRNRLSFLISPYALRRFVKML